MKNVRVMILTVLALACLNGCHTMAGIGQDMQQGGQEIQKAAAK